MKQSIQLRLGQHLAMTPQLQQAIRLLQLSTLELQLEIQNTLDSNLMLEVDEDEHPVLAGPVETSDEADYRHETTGSEAEAEPEADYPSQESGIPDELATDSSWEDTFDNTNADGSSPYSQPEDGGRDRLELAGDSTETLYDHLMWQMHLTPFSDTDQAIAMSVIDAINDDGYLDQTLEEIHQGLNGELDLSIEEVEAVLHRVQNFDPVGVGARNLQECLLIQLRQFAPDTPWLKEATRLVEQHLDLLGSRDYNQLMRQTKLNEQQLSEVISLIQSLNPRPGSQIATEPPQYIVPDVLVKKVRGKWRVELNPDTAPKLRINSHYASLVKRADNSDDNNYLKNHLQEARWFMKSLQSRNETLLKVASSIVERQRDFLDQGEQAMKPLVLRDVAEAVEMHESTISRITTQKYMHTPRGIFEFKYFFSSHVGTTDGGEASATAIRAIIRKLVAEEKPTKPLSDSKLAKLLLDQGINVARRTVAKYRETLNIPPSNERKRLT